MANAGGHLLLSQLAIIGRCWRCELYGFSWFCAAPSAWLQLLGRWQRDWENLTSPADSQPWGATASRLMSLLNVACCVLALECKGDMESGENV